MTCLADADSLPGLADISFFGRSRYESTIALQEVPARRALAAAPPPMGGRRPTVMTSNQEDR